MLTKTIRTEQWEVRTLMNYIHTGQIEKPKFQRKKKWNILPQKEDKANERKYIDFLFTTKHTIQPITFGINDNIHKNIDGNNRICAYEHFLRSPFDIYPEYLNDIKIYVMNTFPPTVQKNIMEIFEKMNYASFIQFRYKDYFNNNGFSNLYKEYLQAVRDEFEDIIEKIQKSLLVDKIHPFDVVVKIAVSLCENYSIDELCGMFDELNRYNSPLTATEMLACHLYNQTHFDIYDNIITTSIKSELITIYKDKSEGEALKCYQFSQDEQMNAYDFILGFQSFINKKCSIVQKVDDKGLALFFKVYKTMYGGYKFNTETVNDFITKITKTADILCKIKDLVYTDKIEQKLFEVSSKKLEALKKNHLYIIMISICGYIRNNETDDNIVRSITICILYHFFVKDISMKDKRKELQIYDKINYEAGGNFIDTLAEQIYNRPEDISKDITSDRMVEVLNILFQENNKPVERFLPDGKDKKNKRRTRDFYEIVLWFFYYKSHVPLNLLDKKFWIEHISPFSCDWDGKIDIDRLGNVIPIVDKLNSMRQTKHISEYVKHDTNQFMSFITDIIPTYETYDTLISHIERKPKVIDNDVYNTMCSKNEQRYLDVFIAGLY